MSSEAITKNDLTKILNKILMLDGVDMTESEVTEFIDSLNLTAANAVDYIVEEGTSGIWSWRKWNSGIAECWGVASSTTAFAARTAPIYYGTTSVAENFPTGLFNSVPNLNVSMRATGADVWVGSSSSGGLTATNTGQYYPLRVNSSGSSVSYRTYFCAKGRWK